MAEKLTPSQEAAVTDRGGPLLVSAAAGSGKTKVLVDRLMSYLLNPKSPANIDEFLIITYTKAAAAELRGKIAAKLTELLAQHPENRHLRMQLQRLYLAKISTVHSFCSDLLREYAFSLDLPGDMRVAEEQEAQELRLSAMDETLEAAYGEIQQKPAFQAFVDTQGAGRNDNAAQEIVFSVYNSAQCHVHPQAWLEKCLAQGDTEGLTDAAQTIWGRYILDRLQESLEGLIQLHTQLLHHIRDVEDICTKYSPALEDDLAQLEALLACNTWEDCRNHLISSFSRLGTLTHPSDPELAEMVKSVREKMKEQLKAIQTPFLTESSQLLEDLEQAHLANKGLCDLVMDFSRRYTLEKERRRVVDFGDLEHKTLELLLGKNITGPTWAAKEIGARFREVMVDEYQDTNEVQDCIFSAITQKRGNCFMVGDVKQSIYRFRLADPGIFLNKYTSFLPHTEEIEGQGRKILLSDNFRSGEEVLAAANHVFRLSMCPRVGGLYYGEAESLRAGVPHQPLPQTAVELHCIQLVDSNPKVETEPSFVARRIQQLLQEKAMIRTKDGFKPVQPGDIVILLRSPSNVAMHYMNALTALGIPATTEAGADMMQSSEISILHSLLQVLDNPLQDIPLQSILLSPLFDFSADHLASVRAKARKCPLYESLQKAADEDHKVSQFLCLMDSLRETARRETLTRLLDEIYEKTHIEAVFAAMDEGENRQRNLRFFYETAAAFQQGGRDLSQFLDHLIRLQERGLKPEDGAAPSGAVSILSIHKSKGLEYPVVFISNLSGKFNQEDLHSNVLSDPELGIGACAYDEASRSRYPTLAKSAIKQKTRSDNVSEELRVLYVAMTRAKDMLIMTYADKFLLTTLKSFSHRLTPENAYVISPEANCLGHWVLMAAMLRTEAGELFRQAGHPLVTDTWDDYPWKITYQTSAEIQEGVATGGQEAAPETVLPDETALEAALSFQYSHAAAVQAPSKVTATQLKGRNLDSEAADGAFQSLPSPTRRFRTPSFMAPAPLQGREIGTATHLAMQFIRYEACTDRAGVEQELKRLLQEEFLTQRQFEAVNREWITEFFQTPLGCRLREGTNILREFKFSILEDGKILDADLAGEQMLLQGVVDCCILDEDGLTILDFKTDRVYPGKEEDAAGRYAPQVKAYGRALSKVWSRPVKKLLLYFFRTGCLLEVPVNG